MEYIATPEEKADFVNNWKKKVEIYTANKGKNINCWDVVNVYLLAGRNAAKKEAKALAISIVDPGEYATKEDKDEIAKLTISLLSRAEEAIMLIESASTINVSADPMVQRGILASGADKVYADNLLNYAKAAYLYKNGRSDQIPVFLIETYGSEYGIFQEQWYIRLCSHGLTTGGEK